MLYHLQEGDEPQKKVKAKKSSGGKKGKAPLKGKAKSQLTNDDSSCIWHTLWWMTLVRNNRT